MNYISILLVDIIRMFDRYIGLNDSCYDNVRKESFVIFMLLQFWDYFYGKVLQELVLEEEEEDEDVLVGFCFSIYNIYYITAFILPYTI